MTKRKIKKPAEAVQKKSWLAKRIVFVRAQTSIVVKDVRLIVSMLGSSLWKLVVDGDYRREMRELMVEMWADFKEVMRTFYFESSDGKLSWAVLMRMAMKKLIMARSRTFVTAGAMAIGMGAIVFLVGFGYGLQDIVNNRLIRPYSMRLMEVRSGSTALQLDDETLDQIGQIPGVSEVEPAVSLAGIVRNESFKTDVVVLAAHSRYMEFVYDKPVEGEWFSEEADKFYGVGGVSQLRDLMNELEGEVAGLSTNSSMGIELGEEIEGQDEEVYVRIRDGVYIPVWDTPSINGSILGYVRGSVVEKYSAKLVWGGEYSSVDSNGRYIQDEVGDWWGRWAQVTTPLSGESIEGVYLPKLDDEGEQRVSEGYISLDRSWVLSNKEMKVEKLLGQVLGDTDEVSSTGSGDVTVLSSDGEESELEKLLEDEETKLATASSTFSRIEIEKPDGKELLVSRGLLSAWGIDNEKDIIGTSLDMEYIISGSLVSGLGGRVMSQSTTYKIVGVADVDQPMVFAPLSDLQSMGLDRYSVASVLVDEEENLSGAREKIEVMGFVTQSLVDTLAQVDRLFRVMRFLLGIFGTVALVVALFGMFNTLTISLLERTREIGVMKTLGTTDYDVVRLFLIESVGMGVVGGVFGVTLGIFGGFLVDVIIKLIRWDMSLGMFRFPLGLLFGIVLLATMVGGATGLYPASRAKKISALDALRYE